ncbi:DUF3078 domain-containing protein [bacterium]|nr:DUF3078 domain-containing protein [bacterium]
MKHLLLPILMTCISATLLHASFRDSTATDSSAAASQPWKRRLNGTITLAQTGYSNWAKGGQNSITWNTRLTGDASRTLKKWHYVFSALLVFGQTKQEDESVRNAADQIDLDAAIACKTNKYINPEFGVGLLTQFSKGYDYKKEPPVQKSNFFDPAYITQSLGGMMKIGARFSSRLGIALKQTVTRDFNAYSDDPKTEKVEKIKIESGIDSKTDLVNAELSSSLVLRSKLYMFSSFEHLDVIDMDWDTLFTAKVNSHIVVTLNILLKYDKDLIDKLQFQETTSLGLSYNFI